MLIPFIVARNPLASQAEIEAAYRAASLGQLDPDAFWRRFDIAPRLEDEYLAAHLLNPDLAKVLREAPKEFRLVGCISNDVDRWSRKLRSIHCLEGAIEHWSISGAVGSRKPARGLYEHFMQQAGAAPEEIVFVDDRLANVTTALELGFRAYLLSSDDEGSRPARVPTISRLADMLG